MSSCSPTTGARCLAWHLPRERPPTPPVWFTRNQCVPNVADDGLAGTDAAARGRAAPSVQLDERNAAFPAVQALFDPLLPKGLKWYWKGDFVKSLPDDAIDVHIAQAAHAPSTLSLMHLYPIDGAVRRVAKDRTAWSARDATWSMVIAAIDPDPAVA